MHIDSHFFVQAFCRKKKKKKKNVQMFRASTLLFIETENYKNLNNPNTGGQYS